jgi:hypothetical protein
MHRPLKTSPGGRGLRLGDYSSRLDHRVQRTPMYELIIAIHPLFPQFAASSPFQISNRIFRRGYTLTAAFSAYQHLPSYLSRPTSFDSSNLFAPRPVLPHLTLLPLISLCLIPSYSILLLVSRIIKRRHEKTEGHLTEAVESELFVPRYLWANLNGRSPSVVSDTYYVGQSLCT